MDGAALGEIGSLMVKIRPDFDARNYGYTKLTDLVTALNETFEICRRSVAEGKPALPFVRRRAHKRIVSTQIWAELTSKHSTEQASAAFTSPGLRLVGYPGGTASGWFGCIHSSSFLRLGEGVVSRLRHPAS
ncbi:hypothetical protein MY4038_007654 [Beauveria bassiana]